jgi:hypothetical protein
MLTYTCSFIIVINKVRQKEECSNATQRNATQVPESRPEEATTFGLPFVTSKLRFAKQTSTPLFGPVERIVYTCVRMGGTKVFFCLPPLVPLWERRKVSFDGKQSISRSKGSGMNMRDALPVDVAAFFFFFVWHDNVLTSSPYL